MESNKTSSILDKEFMRSEIFKKTEWLFNKLVIKGTFDTAQKLRNALKIFEYVVKNVSYDSTIMQEKIYIYEKTHSYDNIVINDIYNCLVRHKSVCTSDSSTLAYLFTLIGLDAKLISIKSKDNSSKHQIVGLTIGGKIYYCDATIVRTSYNLGLLDKICFVNFLYEEEVYFKKIRNDFYVISGEMPMIELDGPELEF